MVPKPPPDAPSDDPLLGRQIGEFRIVRYLTEGGFGVLHIARHMWAPEMRCVIKTLLPKYASNHFFRQRFLREGEALARLNHDNIVPIKTLGVEPDGLCYLVMPYLEGETLQEYLESGRKLDLRQVLSIVAQIASALQAAHDIGIIHRDMKPGNVYLEKTRGGKIKARLLDFGLAHDENARDGLKTKTGWILGTPVYSASEQLEDSSRVTRLSDVFSLAVMTFEMLVGKLPWPEAPSTVIQHRDQKTLPPHPPKNVMPPPVRAVVFKSLSHEPAQRHQSAREFVTALASAIPRGAQIVQRVADDLLDVPHDEMTLRGGRRQAAEKIVPRLEVRAPTIGELLADALPRKTPPLREPQNASSPDRDDGIPVPAVTQNLRAASAPGSALAAEDAMAQPREWPRRSLAQDENGSLVEVDESPADAPPRAQRTTARPGDAQPEPWFASSPPAQRTTARVGDAQPDPWLDVPPAQRTTARPGAAQPEPRFDARPPAHRTTARPIDAQPEPQFESPQRVAALFSVARPLDSQGNLMLSAATPPSEQRFQTLDLGVMPVGTPRSIAVPRRAYWKVGIVIGMAIVAAAGAGSWALFTQSADSPDLDPHVNAGVRADASPHIGSSVAPALSPAPPRIGDSPGAGSSSVSSSPALPPTSSNGSNTAPTAPVAASIRHAETRDPDAGVPVASRPASAGSSRRDAAAEELSTARSSSSVATPRLRAVPPAPAVARGEGELFVALAPGLGSATIYIDNKNLGDTPYRGRLAAGAHIIRVVSNADAKKIKIYKVTIKPDTETERTVKDWQ